MTTTDKLLLALERLDDLRHRSPIVLTTQKRQRERDRNAFMLGVDAGRYGLVTGSEEARS